MIRQKTHTTVLAVAILGSLVMSCNRTAQYSHWQPTLQQSPSTQAPLPARIEQTTEVYFGKAVSDPYRWMEKAENQEELRAGLRAQGEHARHILDRLPMHEHFSKRLAALTGSTSSVRSLQFAGDSLFFLKTEQKAQVAKLMVRDARGVERVLVDPESFEGGTRSHVAINNFSPSPDGRLVAYSLSARGDEIGEVRFIESATGRNYPDILTRIWGEFRVQWKPDSTGVFYTQMLKDGFVDPKLDKLQNMRVFYHRLATSMDSDVLILGSGTGGRISFAPEEFLILNPVLHSEWVLGYGIGARADRRIFVTKLAHVDGLNTPWSIIAQYSDKVNGTSLKGDMLYYLTTKDASRGEIRRLSLTTSSSLARSELVVPQGQGILQNLVAAKDALYFSSMDAGTYQLYRLPYGSAHATRIQLPFSGTLALVDTPSDFSGVVFSLEGWTQVMRYLAYRPSSDQTVELDLKDESPANYEGMSVEHTEVRSWDGTLIPLTILRQRGLALNGQHPTILTGYGGYGIARTPRYSPTLLAWLEAGGIYAYAHVRGGGEKGREWHLAGQGRNKKNAIQDFIACAEYLIRMKYTTSRRLAARGGSMGGVLIGRAVTERPDLFGAATIAFGVLNPLRYLEAPNGANQKAEFDGTPDTQGGFESLLAMDPYHHIEPGVDYPPFLVMIGLNDQRVAPWMSAKFAARLQSVSMKKSSVLTRTNDDEGHGMGSTKDQEVARLADEWAFYLDVFRSYEGSVTK